MIVTCVYVHVISDKIDDFIRVTTENHSHSLKEPGNLRFDLLQEANDPTRFMIYEAYESEEAALLHKNTDHYFKWRDTVANWMFEPRNGVKYNIVVPVNKTEW